MRDRHVLGETWIEAEWPYASQRRGRVRFPDGKLRMVRLADTADTFFTVPARPYRGPAGFVMVRDAEFRFFPSE